MISNLGNVYSQNKLLYNKDEKKILLDGNVLIILKNPKTKINANKLIINLKNYILPFPIYELTIYHQTLQFYHL